MPASAGRDDPLGGRNADVYVWELKKDIDGSVRESVSHLPRRVTTKRVRGKRVKVGFYEAVGCTGNRRTAQTTYTSETGQVTKSTSDRAKC